jgi:hypothetical protein
MLIYKLLFSAFVSVNYFYIIWASCRVYFCDLLGIGLDFGFGADWWGFKGGWSIYRLLNNSTEHKTSSAI